MASDQNPKQAPVNEEIPQELVPVIIAAAATALGKPIRIKDIVLVSGGKPNVWGTQGRLIIHGSHSTASQQW